MFKRGPRDLRKKKTKAEKAMDNLYPREKKEGKGSFLVEL